MSQLTSGSRHFTISVEICSHSQHILFVICLSLHVHKHVYIQVIHMYIHVSTHLRTYAKAVCIYVHIYVHGCSWFIRVSGT